MTMQRPDGELFARLCVAGSDSVLVRLGNAECYKDPSKVEVGDIVVEAAGKLAAVIEVAVHEYTWSRQRQARLVNLAGVNQRNELLKWSTPVDTQFWRVEGSNPCAKNFSELRVEDYVWFPTAESYARLTYLSS